MNHHDEMQAALEAMEKTNEALQKLSTAVGDIVDAYETTAVRMGTLLEDLKEKAGV